MNPKEYLNKIQFIDRIAEYRSVYKLYSFCIEEGLRAIPFDFLKNKCSENYIPACGISHEEYFLVELMDWFKNHFFTWTNSPDCGRCKDFRTILLRKEAPSKEEKSWLTKVVEIYECQTCSFITKFPRYQHPVKLLDTRNGRCGEYAICFTFLIYSLGYRTRLIVDYTDHVWTEIFLDSVNRWVHFDCSENIFDAPLVYELGWQKRLNYVIAIADEIQDVTWRYVTDFQRTLKRRCLFDESWLVSYLFCQFAILLERTKNPNLKEYRLMQRLLELFEFLKPPICKKLEEKAARTSGIARDLYNPFAENKRYVFELTDTEKRQKFLKVAYSITKDKYIRPSTDNWVVNCWENCAYMHKNIFRKLEFDWETEYFARIEHTIEAVIAWQFDLTPCEINSIQLMLSSTVYEKNTVSFKIISDDISCTYSTLEPIVVLDQFYGKSKLIVEACLFSRNWQHAQLFRRHFSTNDYPFIINISLI